MAKPTSKATIAKRRTAPPLAQHAIDIAHILDETIAAGRGADVLPTDRDVVIGAAFVEYLRLFPRSTHVTGTRRGTVWYDRDASWRERGSLAILSGTWVFHCKLCHEELAEVSMGRGEGRFPSAFVEGLNRHGLGCAIALVLWRERMATRLSPDLIVPRSGDAYDDQCPARAQPAKRRRRPR